MFLTFFVMSPVLDRAYNDGYKLFSDGSMPMEQAVQRGVAPFKTFMLKQTRETDLALFAKISKAAPMQGPEDVPLSLLVPAFVTSELKTGFQIGFTVFILFLIIDMVVASVLMSMGMMMVSPSTVSLPFADAVRAGRRLAAADRLARAELYVSRGGTRTMTPEQVMTLAHHAMMVGLLLAAPLLLVALAVGLPREPVPGRDADQRGDAVVHPEAARGRRDARDRRPVDDDDDARLPAADAAARRDARRRLSRAHHPATMFSVTYAQLNGWLTAFLWPFVRMLALVATAPVVGHAAVPIRVKIGLAAFMALVVAPRSARCRTSPCSPRRASGSSSRSS